MSPVNVQFAVGAHALAVLGYGRTDGRRPRPGHPTSGAAVCGRPGYSVQWLLYL